MDGSMSDRSPWPVLLLAAALLPGCAGELPESGDSAPATAVVSETVSTQSWRDSIEALGTAKANESVTLTSKVSETVRKVAFDSGDVVRAGDVIVDLSSGAQLASLDEARAAFQESERQLARGEELAPTKVISESQLDTLRSLGLRKIGHTVEVEDNEQARGMLHRVRHLVKVEEG